MSVEETTIRDDLEKAFEQHEQTEEGRQVEDTQEPIRPAIEEIAAEPKSIEELEVGEPGERGADGRVRGADGKFAKKSGEQLPKDVPALPEKAAGEQSAKPADSLPAVAPPVGWKAQAKNEWAKIPRAAQEEIARREKETATALSHSKNARQLFDEFNNTIAPFMPLIRAQNSTPMVAVKNLMTTAAGLTVGSPQQKAQIVAEMIGNFGVDIETLDKLLAGQYQQGARPAPVGTSHVEVAIQRQLQPVYDFMNSMKNMQTQRESQIRAEVDAEVDAFAAKHEFFEELREEVADLMEVAANRGKIVTLEDAYNKTVALHPEYSKVVAQRQAAAKARQQSGNVQKARAAASSISGSPVVNTPTNEPKNRRDDIAAAWDELAQR